MPASTSDHDRNAATFAALFGLLLCSIALLGLAALVIPDILFVLLVLAGVTGLGALQYVVWGWRLDRYRVADDEELPEIANTSGRCVRGLKWGSLLGPVVGIGIVGGLYFVKPELVQSRVGPVLSFVSAVCWGIPAGALTGSLLGSGLDLAHHREQSSFVLTLALTCLWVMLIGFPLLLFVKTSQ